MTSINIEKGIESDKLVSIANICTSEMTSFRRKNFKYTLLNNVQNYFEQYTLIVEDVDTNRISFTSSKGIFSKFF